LGISPKWLHPGVLALVVLVSSVVSAEPSTPTNLLVICIDTLRADHTSLYGYERDTTPGLAKLAAEGALFRVAYAPVSATAPTHASLFSGRTPPSHGLIENGLVLSDEVQTLAEILAARGFVTSAVVSSFVLDRRFGLARGFAHYQDDFAAAEASVELESWAGFDVPAGFDRRADATTKRAIRALWTDRKPDAPFFLFVHYFDPHTPYDPPVGFKGRFPPPTSNPFRGAKDRATYRDVLDNYDGEIAFTDHEISKLIEAFAIQGILDDTLVVVTSDHGEGLMQHGTWRHGNDVHEETVRVPLLVRWPPRIAAGLRSDAPVALVDVAPTVLELLGVDADSEVFQGRSLAPFLLGGAALDDQRPVFLYRKHFDEAQIDAVTVSGEQFGVRVDHLKLIEHTRGEDELYDLSRDPGERKNRHADSPEDVARLKEILDAWKSEHPTKRSEPTLDGSVRRALEALGYGE
jgi:choline-sulfatase